MLYLITDYSKEVGIDLGKIFLQQPVRCNLFRGNYILSLYRSQLNKKYHENLS
jgi:hypothetical protein